MQHPDSTNRELPPQDHPRKFHEVFVLRAAEATEGGQPKVCHIAETMLMCSTLYTARPSDSSGNHLHTCILLRLPYFLELGKRIRLSALCVLIRSVDLGLVHLCRLRPEDVSEVRVGNSPFHFHRRRQNRLWEWRGGEVDSLDRFESTRRQRSCESREPPLTH